MREDKLHSILRTNKNNARYIGETISEEYKANYSSYRYIRGYKVLELIAKGIEEGGTLTKSMYLETSKKYYDSINVCDKVKLIRFEYDYSIREQRKKLKKKRIRKYSIEFDELTKEAIKRGSEFSHIRSVSMYRYISDNIENGLVVNKDTHKIITSRGINDENELLYLCNEYGWSTEWYTNYVYKLEWLI